MRTLSRIAHQLDNYAVAPEPELKAIAQELRDMENSLRHNLQAVNIFSATTGTYVCSCGQHGATSLASHLGSTQEVERRLIKNHELHATRAYVRTLKGI